MNLESIITKIEALPDDADFSVFTSVKQNEIEIFREHAALSYESYYLAPTYKQIQAVRHKRKSSRRWQKKWLKKYGLRNVRDGGYERWNTKYTFRVDTLFSDIEIEIRAKLRNDIRIPSLREIPVYGDPRESIPMDTTTYQFSPIYFVQRVSRHFWDRGASHAIDLMEKEFWRHAEKLINESAIVTTVKIAA